MRSDEYVVIDISCLPHTTKKITEQDSDFSRFLRKKKGKNPRFTSEKNQNQAIKRSDNQLAS